MEAWLSSFQVDSPDEMFGRKSSSILPIMKEKNAPGKFQDLLKSVEIISEIAFHHNLGKKKTSFPGYSLVESER